VRGAEVRSRLLSPREAATLMGLDFGYALPETYEGAFRILGDGVAVPAVRFIRDRLLEPVLVRTNANSRGCGRRMYLAKTKKKASLKRRARESVAELLH
jgi:DNA (cytosine-5)-methyltransferase 1